MSIGPQQKDDDFRIPVMSQMRSIAKKTLISSAKDPLKNLFYLFLFTSWVGLTFGQSFPIEFYVILIVLGVVQWYKYHQSQSIIISGESNEKNK